MRRGREWERGLSSLLPGIPRALPFFLSPGLRLRALYGQSRTNEASAEESDAGTELQDIVMSRTPKRKCDYSTSATWASDSNSSIASEERQDLMAAMSSICFVLDPICYPGQELKMSSC